MPENSTDAYLMARGETQDVARIGETELVSGVVSSSRLRDLESKPKPLPLGLAIGLRPQDSYEAATAKINAAVLRMLIESLSTPSRSILTRALELATGYPLEEVSPDAHRIWLNAQPAKQRAVYEALSAGALPTASASAVARGLVAAKQALEAILTKDEVAQVLMAVHTAEVFIPTPRLALSLWREKFYLSPLYAPYAGASGNGLDRPSIEWKLVAGLERPRLTPGEFTSHADASFMAVWAALPEDVQKEPLWRVVTNMFGVTHAKEGDTLATVFTSEENIPVVDMRGMTALKLAELAESGSGIVSLIASDRQGREYIQRFLVEVIAVWENSEREDNASPGAFAMLQVVSEAMKKPDPMTYQSLTKMVWELKRRGGIERGGPEQGFAFLAPLAAKIALPAVSSLIGGGGGLSGILGGLLGGGGLFGGGQKSSSPGFNPLGLLSGLLGGTPGVGGDRAASSMSGSPGLSLVSGFLKKLMGRGGPDFYGDESGGRRRRKKRRRKAKLRLAPPEDEREQMDEENVDAERFEARLRAQERRINELEDELEERDSSFDESEPPSELNELADAIDERQRRRSR